MIDRGGVPAFFGDFGNGIDPPVNSKFHKSSGVSHSARQTTADTNYSDRLDGSLHFTLLG